MKHTLWNCCNIHIFSNIEGSFFIFIPIKVNFYLLFVNIRIHCTDIIMFSLKRTSEIVATSRTPFSFPCFESFYNHNIFSIWLNVRQYFSPITNCYLFDRHNLRKNFQFAFLTVQIVRLKTCDLIAGFNWKE